MSVAREAAVALDATTPESLFTKLRPGPGREASQVADHQRARIRRAMIEAVAEGGYDGVTVRGLSQLAGVSTRSFYQHYSSKEECLLEAHQAIVRRWLRRLSDLQEGGVEHKRAVGLVLGALVEEWSRDPQAARLALIEAYASGPTALERAHRADRAIEARIAAAFDRTGDEGLMTPLLVEGVAAGTAAVARSRLLSQQDEQLGQLGQPLAEWASSYASIRVAQLSDLDRDPALGFRYSPDDVPAIPSGDLDLLLTAVGKLVAADGHDDLAVRKVLSAAGVPRRAFYANFSGVEDCVARAFEEQAARALERMENAAAAGATPAGAVYRAVCALCDQVAGDPMFASLCFGEVASLGSPGLGFREQFMDGVLRIVSRVSVAVESPSGRIAAEASVGAAWAILERKVTTGHAHQAAALTASLTYLFLAPSVGTPVAIEAMQKEQAKAARV